MRKHLFWILTGTLFLVVVSWGVYRFFFTGADSSAPDVSGKLSSFAEFFFPDTNPAPADVKNQTGAGLAVSIPNPSEADFLGYQSQYGNLPTSLQGAEIPGQIQIEKGNLKINKGIREMFDFFLSGISDETKEISLGRIREYARHKLEGAAALQAEQILADYVACNDYLAQQQLYNRIPVPNAADDRQTQLKNIREVISLQMEARRRFLGSQVADAFFADDEAYDLYSLRKLEISADSHLSTQEKKNQLRMLEQEFNKPRP
jgi:hypothetical protein